MTTDTANYWTIRIPKLRVPKLPDELRLTRKQWIITGMWLLVYVGTDGMAITHSPWAPIVTPVGLVCAWYLGMAYQRAAKKRNEETA